MGDERRRRLLVVEDSPMMVRMYRMVLGPRYELAFAADGAEGLDAAAREPDVDGMVVDINMPGMDGLEFVRRLRSELGMTEVPVLVCSTEATEADREAARAAGANGFLPKPWQPAELLAALDERLGGAG
ncbi:response regulator [Longimicrobium sp.]|uniref:response regulator n=1 Tax=Longimicrobium sp. TaxID=2029185 RepID=UPI003B3A412A